MNLSDDEEAPVAGQENRKRKLGEGTSEPTLRLSSLAPDKFGALRDEDSDKRPSVHRRVQTTVDSSTGSFTPAESIHDRGGGSRPAFEDQSISTWSRYIEESTSAGQPGCGVQLGGDYPSSHSSVPTSCTLQERTSSGPAATLQAQHQFFAYQAPPSEHNASDSTRVEPAPGSKNEVLAEQNESETGAAGSLPTALSRIYSIQVHSPDHCYYPRGASTASVRFNNEQERAGSSSDDLPRFAPVDNMADYPESSDGAWHSRQSTGQYPLRINYRFASASLESSLLERMEQRQRAQDEDHREEQICSHVISPEDLVWGSVKHYCGMVLDRETSAVLGTAILFMPPDHQSSTTTPGDIPAPSSTASTSTTSSRQQGAASASRSAWVTSVKVVEGRTEVLIKNSRGNVHVAQLMLTSTALGLALFSLHVGQGTFALAFLSRVIGPGSLPHRVFVDVERSDRVYVIGYEEPWESEVGTISDVRVRPGRIVDAGRHAIVEIDFTSGQLGGSIDSPLGFRGGLVVRADGFLAGVVTGDHVAENHPTNIDFAPAFNVYSLLEEL